VKYSSRYRSKAIAENLVALSVSYQRDDLLARGMGLEHLRELLIRLARPLLRQGASLAYGGHWRVADDNFTYDLLNLISAEQEDNSVGGPDTALQIGRLYNHSPWPAYLEITPRIEAQWINACRVVRVSQEQAGLSGSEAVPDDGVDAHAPRTRFNRAVVLSAMRRLQMRETWLEVPGVSPPERVPPVVARILMGGKVDGYSGFLPGLFEESLVTLAAGRPLYVLGGFGGTAQILADAMLATGDARPEELTLDWHLARTPQLERLRASSGDCRLPESAYTTEAQLDALFELIKRARADLVGTLGLGLSTAEAREMMQTREISAAVRLVRKGLQQANKLPILPA
jgi:hypothetical protein